MSIFLDDDSTQCLNKTFVLQILEYLGGGELFERILECRDHVITEYEIAGFIQQILEGIKEYMYLKNVSTVSYKFSNGFCF
jgi:serine/threonine protein kinase